MIRKTYNAEVVLTILNDDGKEITDQDIDFAQMEAEITVNNLGYSNFFENQLGIRMHILGEKNGDN